MQFSSRNKIAHCKNKHDVFDGDVNAAPESSLTNIQTPPALPVQRTIDDKGKVAAKALDLHFFFHLLHGVFLDDLKRGNSADGLHVDY